MSELLSSDLRNEVNTALLEVDKGLRSARIGEQCEAVVKFPALVDRFPFPVLVNVAFLKLADVFRTGTNLLRLNILKVLQVTENHLNKITNVEEFLRRIYSVVHSNDPVARAVTLRVFGSIASVIAERKSVHHCIHRSLESHDQVEVDAALLATSQLCRHSSAFASGVSEKIANMVQGLMTPVDMKLKLIPILEQLHHNIDTATQVRELCLRLLPRYPALSFVVLLLHTLTRLATATLLHIPHHVVLLLDYAQHDARKVVRCKALQEMLALATAVPHTWTHSCISSLLSAVDKMVTDKEKDLALLTLYKLSGSVAVHSMASLKDSIAPYSYTHTLLGSACAVAAVTNIVFASPIDQEQSADELEQMSVLLIESLVVMDHSQPNSAAALRIVLLSLVKLSSHTKLSMQSLNTLPALLPSLPSPRHVAILCKALASVAGVTPDAWRHTTPPITRFLESRGPTQPDTILPLATLLMELHRGSTDTCQHRSFNTRIIPSLQPILCQHSSLWTQYTVARKASMLGFHELSEAIYLSISEKVTALRFRSWLYALHRFSAAQNLLQGADGLASLITALQEASAITSSTALLVKTVAPSSFPADYLTAVCALMDAHCCLLSSCVTLHTAPSHCSHLTLEQKLQHSVQQFQRVAKQWSTLQSCLFDADPSTLDYLTLLQQSCVLMASIISTALSCRPLVSPARVSTPMDTTPSSSSLPVSFEVSDNFNTGYLLGQACRSVLQSVQSNGDSLQSIPVTQEHTSFLSKCSHALLHVPFLLPKLFFTRLQHTTLKLEFSPSLPPAGQPILLTLSSYLALKVEGVVGHLGKPNKYRKVVAVSVEVIPKVEKIDGKPPSLPPLEKVEVLSKDYFQADFLLPLPSPGSYSLSVQPCLVDEGGRPWTGPGGACTTVVPVLVDTQDNLQQYKLQQQQQQQQEN